MIDGIAYKPDVIMIIGYAKSRNEENAVMTDLMAALMFMTPIFDVGRSEQAVAAFNHLGYPLCLRAFKPGPPSSWIRTALEPGSAAPRQEAFASMLRVDAESANTAGASTRAG